MFEVAANLRIGILGGDFLLNRGKLLKIENPIGRSVDLSKIGRFPTKSVDLTGMRLAEDNQIRVTSSQPVRRR